MHEVGLAPSQELHLVHSFAIQLAAMQSWRSQTMNNPVSVLILSFLQMSLNHFGIVCLKTVWLNLEAFVDFLHILNVILYCLSTLLLDCQVAQAATECWNARYWVQVAFSWVACRSWNAWETNWHWIVLESQHIWMRLWRNEAVDFVKGQIATLAEIWWILLSQF